MAVRVGAGVSVRVVVGVMVKVTVGGCQGRGDAGSCARYMPNAASKKMPAANPTNSTR